MGGRPWAALRLREFPGSSLDKRCAGGRGDEPPRPAGSRISSGIEPSAARPSPGGRPTDSASARPRAPRRDLSVEPSSVPGRRCVAELRPIEALRNGQIYRLRGAEPVQGTRGGPSTHLAHSEHPLWVAVSQSALPTYPMVGVCGHTPRLS